MPFKIKWPFRWPWQKRPAAANLVESEPVGQTPPAATPLAVARPEPPGRGPEPADPIFRASRAASPHLRVLGAPDPSGEGYELGAELLSRAPQLGTPPTLGRQGGLPAMAQTLPTVERFMQNLPAPPVQRLLEGALTQSDEFAASLPSLASYGGATPAPGAPAFPDTLASAETPTDVLPPMGALPGQAPALSGEAPVLTPTGPPHEIVRVVTERVQPSTPAPEPFRLVSPAAPLLAPAAPAPAPAVAPHWPMTQVLPVERTLAGNVLPAPEGPPVLRSLEPGTPAGLGELVRPGEAAGERVSPEQRTAIESQRGQGAPLAPEVRQRFEASYGQSLADVRIHTGQAAHSTAESLNAMAFASGRDLFFTQNTFRPDSEQGLGLIGHELAHVVQQQYGVPGDADALRPADDGLEQQADRLAATALETPLAAPAAAEPAAGPPIQRAIIGSLPRVEAEPRLQQPYQPDVPLWRGLAASATERPLSLGPTEAEPAPIQRFSLGSLGGMARQVAPQLPSMPDMPEDLPSLDNITERAGDLTDQLPNPGNMLAGLGNMPTSLPSLGGLARNLPSAGALGGMLPRMPAMPTLPAGLPSLSNLPASMGDLAGMVPGAQSAMPGLQGALGGLSGLGGGLPSLGGLTQNLPGGLSDMLPGLPGGMPELPALPSLGGLQMPEMPLAEGMGGLGQALGGAAAAGQEALGSISSMAPSLPEMPAAPPLPSLEKLTEHVWKQVQQKLKVERERARGLA